MNQIFFQTWYDNGLYYIVQVYTILNYVDLKVMGLREPGIFNDHDLPLFKAIELQSFCCKVLNWST